MDPFTVAIPDDRYAILRMSVQNLVAVQVVWVSVHPNDREGIGYRLL